MHRRRTGRSVAVALLVAVVTLAGPALAHSGSLRGDTRALSVPTWLFLATGGGVVGASFLLASFATDRAFVRSVHAARRVLDDPPGALVAGTRVLGLVGLVAVVAAGLAGPADPLTNLGVLVVWGGWWAGFAATTYLVGNAWPAVNPWRTLADLLPRRDRRLPDRVGAWPAVAGLLGLVWLEVVSPLADDPRLLAAVVLAYTAVTLAGAVAYADWFERCDPVSRVFRCYGRVAPLAREDGRLRVRLPGSGLTGPVASGADEVAFVVALLWATTYDGLVATPAFGDLARPLVGAGLPPALLYPVALVAGFALFLAAYRAAVRYGRRHAGTYLASGTLARRFAPSLLAIAAGYHAAHYLGYFLGLLPALVGALANPLAPPDPAYLVLPGWVGGVELGFVLAGHVLAVWVAHGVAYDLFPDRIQAVRSQYALTAVMVGYTATSLFLVSQPTVRPPYL